MVNREAATDARAAAGETVLAKKKKKNEAFILSFRGVCHRGETITREHLSNDLVQLF